MYLLTLVSCVLGGGGEQHSSPTHRGGANPKTIDAFWSTQRKHLFGLCGCCDSTLYKRTPLSQRSCLLWDLGSERRLGRRDKHIGLILSSGKSKNEKVWSFGPCDRFSTLFEFTPPNRRSVLLRSACADICFCTFDEGMASAGHIHSAI